MLDLGNNIKLDIILFLKEGRVSCRSQNSGQTMPRQWAKCCTRGVGAWLEPWKVCAAACRGVVGGVVGDMPENFKVCPCCLRGVEWGRWRVWPLEGTFFSWVWFFRTSFVWTLRQHLMKMHVLLAVCSWSFSAFYGTCQIPYDLPSSALTQIFKWERLIINRKGRRLQQ